MKIVKINRLEMENFKGIRHLTLELNGRSAEIYGENGNLQDCCDALVNGVPYGTVNSAMQINAGLDCIRALSDHYGLRVPLFVDNAESVTHLYDLDTQVIQLVVSKKDKELRCKIQ